MRVVASDLFTQVHPESSLGRFAQFPLIRLLIALLFLAVFLLPHNTVIADFIAGAGEPLHSWLISADAAISVAVLLLIYRFYAKWIEGRRAREIGREGALREFGAGFVLSLGLVGFMVALMAVLGYYRVDHLDSSSVLLTGLFHFGVGAFVQVLIFRLLFFRLTEEILGTWPAFVVSAVVFGLAHLSNEGTTLGQALLLVLGDVLFLGAFVYTRRLWFAWGLHMGWNYFQDGVFGMANSGVTTFHSWISPVVTGPGWLTGGSFGIEASWVAIGLTLVLGIIVLKKAVAREQIVSPVWTRR